MQSTKKNTAKMIPHPQFLGLFVPNPDYVDDGWDLMEARQIRTKIKIKDDHMTHPVGSLLWAVRTPGKNGYGYWIQRYEKDSVCIYSEMTDENFDQICELV